MDNLEQYFSQFRNGDNRAIVFIRWQEGNVECFCKCAVEHAPCSVLFVNLKSQDPKSMFLHQLWTKYYIWVSKQEDK
jgi:hypothetical protein